MNRQASTRPSAAVPRVGGRSVVNLLVAALAAVGASGAGSHAAAQMFGGQAVGGISIDAGGIVRNLDAAALGELAAARRTALRGGGPRDAEGLRKVSLAGIVKAVQAAADGKAPLAPDVVLLGGLERVTHVFVDVDGHDIVLAGPADAARVDAAGNVLGAASGRPLLQLEDLIVALRAADGARDGGMLCSIDQIGRAHV